MMVMSKFLWRIVPFCLLLGLPAATSGQAFSLNIAQRLSTHPLPASGRGGAGEANGQGLEASGHLPKATPVGAYIVAGDFLQPLRGFAVTPKYPLQKSDFDDLRALGAGLLRTGIRLDRCATCGEYTLPLGQLADFEFVLEEAGRVGIKVVLTLVPEDPFTAEYWQREDLQESIVKVWVDIARRYSKSETVAGYDLINEPRPKGALSEASRQWARFANRLIRAIRSVDPHHAIVFEPAPAGSAHAFKVLDGRLEDNNVVYSLHMYKPVEITHQGLILRGEPTRKGVIYPSETWNRARLSAYLDPVRAFARQHRVPIFVGEWGSVRWTPDGTSYRWIRDVLELIEAEGWSWTYWSFRGHDAFDQELPPEAPRPGNERLAREMRSGNTEVFRLLKAWLAAPPGR